MNIPDTLPDIAIIRCPGFYFQGLFKDEAVNLNYEKPTVQPT